MQSAGILVVRPLPPGSESTVERIVDIRVDDHENPFGELRRLLAMTTGVPARLLTRSAELSKAGRHDEAIAEAQKALAINPRSEPAMYQLARRYAAAGRHPQAIEQLARAIGRQPKQWKFEAAADPAFAALRAMPEFQRLIRP
jgi:tetratricopeptide (TPR) repeat protein